VRHRQIATLLALAGLLLSCYLLLHRLGYMGELVCGPNGGCETVQASRYSAFLGIPVAAYGVAGYLSLLVVGMAGLQGRWAESAGPTKLLVLLSGLGVAFTIYLTALELFVIHAICRWCVGSAVIIVLLFVVSMLGLKQGEVRT
jgi:uncharacterized membrane protein